MVIIVLSGGPCSGKSTSMSKIKQAVEEKLGMTVLTIPETATELIANGITPGIMSAKHFQRVMLKKQLGKEELYKGVVRTELDSDNTVILCDRGLLDQLAYINMNDFEDLLAEQGLTLADIAERYDLIIHLITAADGTDCYTTENNNARHETAEEALMLDKKTLQGNSCSAHVKVIDNSTNFEEKVNRAIKLVFQALKKPAPSEIERKFLIKKPTMGDFIDPSRLRNAIKAKITQTYLLSDVNGVERRVRVRELPNNGGKAYYYTEKTTLSSMERIEREEIISSEQYHKFLAQRDPNSHVIEKDRYSFVYSGRYFEMDVYPFDNDYAILEIELESVDDKVDIPKYLSVLKEVTDDSKYKNHSIAKTLSIK